MGLNVLALFSIILGLGNQLNKGASYQMYDVSTLVTNAEDHVRNRDWENLRMDLSILEKLHNGDRLSKREDAIYMQLYGLYFENLSNNENALKCYRNALKFFIETKDIKKQIIAEQDIARIYYYSNQFLEAENILVRALEKAQTNKYDVLRYYLYIDLSLNAREQENLWDAEKYLLKAIDLVESGHVHEHKFHLQYCLNNLAYIKLLMGDLKSAGIILKKMLRHPEIKNDPLLYCRLLDNYGLYLIRKGELDRVNKILEYSYNCRVKNRIEEGQNFNRLYLSFYFGAFDKRQSILTAMQALQLSKSFHAPNDILLCLKHLAKIDRKNALKYSSDYIRISDSMLKQERDTRNKFAKIAFETEEITNEKDIAEKQKSLFMGTTVTVGTIGLLLLVIVRQRMRQHKMEYERHQQKAREEIFELVETQNHKVQEGRLLEKKRIALELHDGVMNRLASTRFNLHILHRKSDPDTIAKCLRHVDEIHDIEKEIRNLAHNLNEEGLVEEQGSFRTVLTRFIDEQKEMHAAQIHADVGEKINWDRLKNTQKINLYRILQELFQNIFKHACAQNIFLQVQEIGDALVVELHDDGIGLAGKNDRGIGLSNLQTRAKEAEGFIDVKSADGHGTTAILSISMDS